MQAREYIVAASDPDCGSVSEKFASLRPEVRSLAHFFFKASPPNPHTA
jgi:hypothetical protein